MSTIKSSDEHLTLNADGSSKDIKFQANGVEKASISSSGAFTSTSIDATKLTGALPAISGAALTGVGVAGISSSADATAITIDSAEQVYISNSNNGNNTVHIKALNSAGDEANLRLSGNVSGGGMGAGEVAGSLQYFNNTDHIASISGMRDGGNEGQLSFKTRGGSDSAPVEQLKITKDGRGLSQFTAKAWGNWNGTGTVALRDSHNCSSIADHGTGLYVFNFATDLANANYCATSMSKDSRTLTFGDSVSVPSAASFQVRCQQSWDASQTDNEILCVTVFGD